MGVFDQASRFTIKGSPPGFFRWLAPRFVERFAFRDWADARTIAFPGEPDRTCDTVAEFVPIDGTGSRRLLDVEPQTEPDGEMLDRCGEYAFRLRRELRYGDARQHKYHVISVVLNLTGPEQPRELDTRDADLDGAGIHLRVFQVTMREQDAAATLARIATDQPLRAVLPFVPLMRRGDEADIIEEWKRLAQEEPDQRRRSDYGGLALVFSELASRRPLWQQALEGWNVKTSQQVLEWQAEARQSDLLRLLERRFRTPVPADLAKVIAELYDHDQLTRWFDALVAADSLDAFRAAVGQPRPPETNGAS
jgi:hypothetical protein